MKIAKFVLIGTTIVMASAASAQELTGMLTMIDRVDHNVAIQRTQNGTVGASTGAIDVLKVPTNVSLEPVHVGDNVTYGVTETGGVKSVTKLEKMKP
jgi:hypothetical protein